MKMDFSKFKHVKSDAKRTILKHPRGHTVTIAHKGLAKEAIDQLHALAGHGAAPEQQPNQAQASMPMMAEGGWSPGSLLPNFGSSDDSSSAPSPQQPPQVQLPPRQPLIQLDPSGQAPQQQQQQPSAQSQSVGQAPSAMDPEQQMLHGQNMQKMGILGEAAAMGHQGDQEAKVAAEQAKSMQAMQQQYQDHYNQLDQERQGFQQDLANGHIDPNHYVNNMSTGSKVASTIGLILGGISSQFNGGHNAALDMLNKHVDQDIEAQKVNLGKTENLLSANMHQFGNLRDATDMTKVMTNDVIAAKLKQAAASGMGPLAQARAMQALGPLEQQNAQLQQTMSMRRSAMGGSNGELNQTDPASYIQYLVPKEQQAEVAKQIDQAKSARQNEGEMMQAFDAAAKENTIMRTGAGMLRTPGSILKMDQLSLPLIHDAEGRVNEFEQKTVQRNYPQPGDTEAKINQKRETMQAFIQAKKSAALAKANNIDLDRFQATATPAKIPTPGQIPPQYLQWAQQNAHDPKAQQILQKARGGR